MKKIQFFLFLSFLMISLTSYPAPKAVLLEVNKDPLSEELAGMLSRSHFVIEEDSTVKVHFTVSENKVIKIKWISSFNVAVTKYLRRRLDGRQLQGNSWSPNKIYELPVRLKAVR